MTRNFYRHMRVKFTCVNKNRGDVRKAARKRKSGASFRFCVCASLLRRGLFVLWGGGGGGAGEKEKESTRGMMGREGEGKVSHLFPLPIVPRALSIVWIIPIFIGIPSGSLEEERAFTR